MGPFKVGLQNPFITKDIPRNSATRDYEQNCVKVGSLLMHEDKQTMNQGWACTDQASS